MALSLAGVTDHIRHTLGGDPATGTEFTAIANDAGQFLCSSYPWRWLEDQALLQGETTEEFIALPTGFAELINFAPRGLDARAGSISATAAGKFFNVSTQEIYDKREIAGDDVQNPTSATWNAVGAGEFYFAIAYHSTGGTTVPVPRVELFPAPVTSGGSGSSHEPADCKMTIVYRRSWTPVSTAASVFVLPTFMEPIYLQCVRAFARGYEEEDIATANARLAEVVSGPLYMTAVQRDSLVETTTLRTVRRSTPTGLAGLAGNANSISEQSGAMGRG